MEDNNIKNKLINYIKQAPKWIVVIFLLLIICLSIYNTFFTPWIDTRPLFQLLTLILSWPAIVLIIAIIFKENIKRRIDNMKEFQGFGGRATFQSTTDDDLKEENQKDDIPPEIISQMLDRIKKDEEKAKGLEEEKNYYKNIVGDVIKNTYFWKHRFLNLFFVEHTKKVLIWFNDYSPITKTHYYNTWNTIINPPNEMEAVLDALKMNGMIQLDEDKSNMYLEVYQITPEGKFFVDHFLK